MVTRTFLTKSNTIIRGSKDNYGLYPISMLNYGNIVSRVILQFDSDRIKDFTKNYYGDKGITHTLKMTNCGSIDWRKLGQTIPSNDINGEKQRACSFTIIAVALPSGKEHTWDEGVGFDSNSDFWFVGRSSTSNEGSNWYNSKSGLEWIKTDENKFDEGIYKNSFLMEQYEKYLQAKLSNNLIEYYNDIDSIIIGEQHFDHGNEDLNIDITPYLEIGGNNNGIMLMFSPDFEELTPEYTQYVGFFNEKTNTFFKPCIETRIDDAIQDNRFDFSLKSDNRLYLYFNNGENYIDLDTNPTCSINNTNYPVKKQFTGCYYITVRKNQQDGFVEDEILNDSWVVSYDSNIEEVEQEFVTHKPKLKFGATNSSVVYEPSLSGIKDKEHLNIGDIRKVNIRFRKPYSSEFKFINNAFYRIYSKEANRETVIIDWDYIENVGDNNYFLIDTNTLVPGDYIVDIKVKSGLETKIFKEKLLFTIPNDVTRITH